LTFSFDTVEIAVNGAVFSDSGILCDPFFTASLLCNEYDHHHMCTVTRIIGVISKAITQLKAKYEGRGWGGWERGKKRVEKKREEKKNTL
jgi:hypothetical protein